MTPDEKAELRAEVQKLFGPYRKPKPKPKVVAEDGVVVRDADVVVSPRDPNATDNKPKVVQVRAPDPGWLRQKPTADEEQIIAANRARMANARLRREADPFGLGHWGPTNE